MVVITCHYQEFLYTSQNRIKTVKQKHAGKGNVVIVMCHYQEFVYTSQNRIINTERVKTARSRLEELKSYTSKRII